MSIDVRTCCAKEGCFAFVSLLEAVASVLAMISSMICSLDLLFDVRNCYGLPLGFGLLAPRCWVLQFW